MKILSITAPYSESRYHYERIGRDGLLGSVVPSVQDLFVQTQSLCGTPTIIHTNNYSLKGALERQNRAKSELNQLMHDLIAKTDFTDVYATLETLNIVRDKLNTCYRYTNIVVERIPETISHKSRGKVHLSNQDKIPFRQESAQYELILNLFTCVDFGIKFTVNPNTCGEFREKAIEAARSLKSVLDEHSQILPDHIRELLSTQITRFNQLFGVVGIEEFFNRGLAPKKLQGTIFDLPSEMTEVYLSLIKTLSEELNKEKEALQCYEHIISKNKSISVVTVLACKEVVKHGQYDLALYLLDMLRVNEERSDIQKLLLDVSILKLFCHVGLGHFHDAEVILNTLPAETLAIVDIRLLQLEVYEKMHETEIRSFREKCYSGNLMEIQSLIDANKSVPSFAILVNKPETLFYIINGKANSREKAAVMDYLNKESLLDLNINNGFALEAAVQLDDIFLVQFLMSEGVKMPPYEDGILLFYAAQQNDYDMFFLLKNTGIQIDSELLGDIKGLELTGALKVAIDHIDVSV